MSMKKSSDTIGNRTRDLPVCSTTMPLRAASLNILNIFFTSHVRFVGFDSFLLLKCMVQATKK
jgi:hypothetical protein